MNISFSSYGKFIHDSTTVELEYSRMTARFQDPISGLRESALTGQRYIISHNYIAEFEFFIHLFKSSDVASTFASYESYIGELVTLYPFKDGDPVQNEWGESILFVMTSCNPYTLATEDFSDVLVLTFKSIENVHMAHKSLVGYGTDYATKYGGGF